MVQDSETTRTTSKPSTPTTTPQPPTYVNDYLANLRVSRPVPRTSEVANDINSYVDDIEFADPSFEGFVGSSANDAVRFYAAESMLIDGLAGNDEIAAGVGDDLLVGGAGADLFDGGDGDDWLFVDSADVSNSGGQGFDTLVVLDKHSVKVNTQKHGIERFFGGDGNDVVRNRRGQASVEYFGGRGHDRLVGGLRSEYNSGGSEMIDCLVVREWIQPLLTIKPLRTI